MSKNRQTLWLKDRGRKWTRNYFLAALIARVQRIGAGGARLPSKSKTNQRVVKREKGAARWAASFLVLWNSYDANSLRPLASSPLPVLVILIGSPITSMILPAELYDELDSRQLLLRGCVRIVSYPTQGGKLGLLFGPPLFPLFCGGLVGIFVFSLCLIHIICILSFNDCEGHFYIRLVCRHLISPQPPFCRCPFLPLRCIP